MYFTTIIILNKPNYMLFARDNSKTSRNGKRNKGQKKIQHANTNQKQAHTNNKV